MRQRSSAAYHRDLKWFAALSKYHIDTLTFVALPCAYCGLPADTRDHFTPLAFYHAGLDAVDMSEMRLTLVPACGECNRIAGSHVFRTVAEKRRYIQARLRCRYKKLLAVPSWTEEELNTLSPSLARYVRRALRLREIISQRITYRVPPAPPAAKPSIRADPGSGSARKPAARITIRSASLPASVHSLGDE